MVVFVFRECSKCQEIKVLADYHSNGKKGYGSVCKKCSLEYQAAWRAKNPERIREYGRIAYRRAMKKNPEELRERRKAWRAKNREKVRKKSLSYYYRNKEKCCESNKAYREANKEKIAARKKLRRTVDPESKMRANLRRRLRLAIQRNQKAGSAVADLGCSIPELKKYLETKFLPGMCWQNYGPDGWHIDHIKPLNSFDLADRQQFLAANHFSNLQPLWAAENLSKAANPAKSY